MKKIVTLISIICSVKAFAGNLVSIQNQEVLAPVNEELGTIFHLPGPVTTVTPSKYFHIVDVGAGIDANGVKTDVRNFQIKPIKGAQSESITFVLTDGKSIALKLLPSFEADKYYEVHFENMRKLSHGIFSHEVDLLKNMISDESGHYSRAVVEKPVESKISDFDFKLVRVFASDDYTGYVYSIKNKSSEPKKIELSKFSFGYPNAAIISHVDKEILSKCPFFGSNIDCETKLEVVVKGQTPPEYVSLSATPPPFIKPGDVKDRPQIENKMMK